MNISPQPIALASERNEIRFCPRCLTPLTMARLESDTPGFELRTFGCPACSRTDRVPAGIDPMLSGANGWVISHLYPPTPV